MVKHRKTPDLSNDNLDKAGRRHPLHFFFFITPNGYTNLIGSCTICCTLIRRWHSVHYAIQSSLAPPSLTLWIQGAGGSRSLSHYTMWFGRSTVYPWVSCRLPAFLHRLSIVSCVFGAFSESAPCCIFGALCVISLRGGCPWLVVRH